MRSAMPPSPRACTTAARPWQGLQQFPFLCRVMAEAPDLRVNFGLVLLSLHKPLDIAEQIATVDVMSGGKVIFGVALGYREVEFLAFGTTQKERVKRFEENLEAVKRLWTEDAVDMVGSHFTLQGASVGTKPLQKPHPPIWIGANADPAIRRAARLGDCWYVNPHNRIDTIVRQVERLPAGARRVRQAVSGGIPGAARGLRRPIAGRGHPALRAVPGRQVPGLSPVGAGQGDARGRQQPRRRLRRADPRPLPARVARRGGRADAGAQPGHRRSIT